MTDKFSRLMDKLSRIEAKLDYLLEKQEEEEWLGSEPRDRLEAEGEDLAGDYHQVYADGVAPDVPLKDRKPRSVVRVRSMDPEAPDLQVDWNDLDARIQEAITISEKQRVPWELYEDPSGNIRIMTSNEVAAEIHKRHTHQPDIRRGG